MGPPGRDGKDADTLNYCIADFHFFAPYADKDVNENYFKGLNTKLTKSRKKAKTNLRQNLVERGQSGSEVPGMHVRGQPEHATILSV